MSLAQKAEAAVRAILKATREQKIEWTQEDPMVLPPFNIISPASVVFTAHIKGVVVATYWRDDQPRLALLDSIKRFLWEFPHTPETEDLVLTASFKGAHIEQFLDEMVKV